jgi:hypothetical protein
MRAASGKYGSDQVGSIPDGISLGYDSVFIIENDILDACTDTKAVEFFSKHFGREHDAEFGPKDLRI